MKENELIQKCKKNSSLAQMQVYNLYKHLLYNASFRILKNRPDAEDAVHDSFINGFQKIHQIKNETNLGAWLKRIAINKSIDIIRKRKNVWVEDLSVIDIAYEEPAFIHENAVSIQYIKKCIASLKEKYRIILILYMIEDYSHKEISTLLHLKESTVRNQYIRGKQQLLKKIQKKQEV